MFHVGSGGGGNSTIQALVLMSVIGTGGKKNSGFDASMLMLMCFGLMSPEKEKCEKKWTTADLDREYRDGRRVGYRKGYTTGYEHGRSDSEAVYANSSYYGNHYGNNYGYNYGSNGYDYYNQPYRQDPYGYRPQYVA